MTIRMRSVLVALVLVALSLMISSPSVAAPIRVEVDGTLSSVSAGLNGQRFSFAFTVDPATGDRQAADSTVGEYRDALSDVVFRIGTTAATRIRPDSPGVVIAPGESFFRSLALLQTNSIVPSPPAPPGFTLFANSESYIGYFEAGFGFARPWQASFDFFMPRALSAPSDLRGRNDLLPADAAAFSARLAPWLLEGVGPVVNLREFFFSPGSQTAIGNIDRQSLRIHDVPEPLTWLLLACALPVLLLARPTRRA